MHYAIRGLAPSLFNHLYGLSEAELADLQVERHIVDAADAYPCRVTLQDAPPGSTVLLLNHLHQPAPGPYRASHAIYVREYSHESGVWIDELPTQFRRRLLSLRAYDARHHIVAAEVCEGEVAEGQIQRLLADPTVEYLHAHYARRGCFAGRIDRHPNP
ncbi:DUF1203 domain-containing protein [Chitinimonas sp.]|uniref:DUF1203 domain-containing protein n=1 Tax=Chitinimonas sp. TaxID=1934313 RepID=UPI002F955338